MSAVGFESHAAVCLLINHWKEKKQKTLCTFYSFCFNTGSRSPQVRCKVQPGQAAILMHQTTSCTHFHTWSQFEVANSPILQMHVFGLWKKAAWCTQFNNSNKLKNGKREMCFDTFVQISKCSSRVLKWHPQWQTLLMAYPICGEKGKGERSNLMIPS